MPQVGQPLEINEDKMNAFLGKVVGDFGASLAPSSDTSVKNSDFTRLSPIPMA